MKKLSFFLVAAMFVAITVNGQSKWNYIDTVSLEKQEFYLTRNIDCFKELDPSTKTTLYSGTIFFKKKVGVYALIKAKGKEFYIKYSYFFGDDHGVAWYEFKEQNKELAEKIEKISKQEVNSDFKVKNGKFLDTISQENNKFFLKKGTEFYQKASKASEYLGVLFNDTLFFLNKQENNFTLVFSTREKKVGYILTSLFTGEYNEDYSTSGESDQLNSSGLTSGESKQSNSSGSTNVKGHYRTNKNGKTYYVKPHNRKKN